MSGMSALMVEILAQDKTRAAFDSAGRGADAFAIKTRTASRAVNDNLRSVQGSTANLAAQFNDIGVQLAGGQSPFLIALQQGTQIGQVLGPMGAAGAVRSLGGAFVSMLSPINLITIGLIAAGGAAYQYFSTVSEDGQTSSEELRKQQDLIGQLVQKWGETLPALKEYYEALKKADDAASLSEGTSLAVNTVLAEQKLKIADVRTEFDVLFNVLNRSNASADSMLELQNAFAAFNLSLKDGVVTTEETEAVHSNLIALFNETGISSVNSFADSFLNLAKAIGAASDKAEKFKVESALNAGKQSLPKLGTLGPVYSGGGKFLDEQQNADFIASNTKSKYQIEMEKIEKANRRTGKTDEEKQADKIQNVVQALEDEQRALGKTKLEQRTMQALRRADVDATSKQGVQIANLVAQIESEKKALKDASDVSDFFTGALKDGFSELIPQIDTGIKALDGFINKLIEASFEAMLFGSGPLSSLFGGGLFGGGNQIAKALGGGIGLYANGTDFAPGGLAIVGERGPELVNLPRGSQVIPNHRMSDGNGSSRGGGGAVIVNIINNSGADVRQSSRQTSDGISIDLMIDEKVAKNMAKPGSATRSSMQGQFGLSSGLNRRG